MAAILCVDDDKRPLDRIVQAIEKIYPDIKIETARSGEEALEKAQSRTEPFKVVLTDYQLSLDKSRLNGAGVARKIRMLKGYRQVPIYLLSGTKRENFVELGFDGSYNKRDKDEIVEVVDRIGHWI